MSLSMNVDLLGRGMDMDMSASDMADMAPMDGMAQDTKMSNDGKTDMGGMASDKPMSGMEQMPKSAGMGSNSSMPNMAGEMNMDMPMTHFLPLFGMWAVMMAAMILPTMVPTLKSYEDLMISAGGTRSGWMGLLLGYSLVLLVFAALITVAQLGLLELKIVNMMGLTSSIWVSAALLFLTVDAVVKRYAKLRQLYYELQGSVFHSTRKWFITQCERTGTPDHFTASLVGHHSARSSNKLTYALYSGGISDAQKREIVDGVRLPTK